MDRRKTVKIVLVFNALFWVALSTDICINAMSFEDRIANFEEELPVYKIGQWAVPVEREKSSILFKVMRSLYFPSYRTAAIVAESIKPEKSWEYRVGPLSMGTYILIGTMLLSFIQAYILAILFLRSVVFFRPRSKIRGQPAD